MQYFKFSPAISTELWQLSLYPELAYLAHLPKNFVFLPDVLVHARPIHFTVLSCRWEIS